LPSTHHWQSSVIAARIASISECSKWLLNATTARLLASIVIVTASHCPEGRLAWKASRPVAPANAGGGATDQVIRRS